VHWETVSKPPPASSWGAGFRSLDLGDHRVALADLLQETGLQLHELHAAAGLLRRRGVVEAVALEGRGTPRERVAAIREGDSLLGYLAVREGRGKEFRALARGG
jgi:hypothetical protein